jgi:hypothetical protein
VHSKTLVAGWFSFEQMGASAGDLMARDVACQWLSEAGRRFDVAVAPPFAGGVDWRTADPADYDQVLFVCGPFGNGEPVTQFLARFAGRRLIGLNLTMLEPLEAWNPFDLLLERDSSRRANPDVALLAHAGRVPVVGVVLIDSQPEYKRRDLHKQANEALWRLIAGRDVAAVPIDTRLDENRTGLRSAAQVESLIARCDVVATTRLHGTVLALKNGVPVVALDPVAGGAKVFRQATVLDWPLIFTADAVTDADLEKGFDYCLTGEARGRARECGAAAVRRLRAMREEFMTTLKGWDGTEDKGRR